MKTIMERDWILYGLCPEGYMFYKADFRAISQEILILSEVRFYTLKGVVQILRSGVTQESSESKVDKRDPWIVAA